MLIDDIEIYKYEVGTIINNNRNTICVSNDLETATYYYEATVKKYNNNTTDNIVIYLYDYDKHANINFYDNQTELC